MSGAFHIVTIMRLPGQLPFCYQEHMAHEPDVNVERSRAVAPLPPRRAQAVAAALLAWYDANGRDLPWRRKKGEGRPDPYAVWLSEIMLQQTTVATVKERFPAFLRRWPTVEALAAASEQDVLAAWAGLGYYARARNLHACAREILRGYGGRFPQSPAALERLPGIGPYTAAAIAAIAFNVPVAAVDGNVERVIARLFVISRPLPAARGEIRRVAQALVPEARPGDFAQALMDLGSLVCRPRAPRCGECPLAAFCRARAEGMAAALPRREKRAFRPRREGVAFVISRADGALLFRRRPSRGLLGGLWELPSQGWDGAPPLWPDGRPFGQQTVALNAHVRHVFSHFELHLRLHRVPKPLSGRLAEAAAAGDNWRWCAPRQAGDLGLSGLMRKALALVS
jgi:A/G-specific adenine glycosylase